MAKKNSATIERLTGAPYPDPHHNESPFAVDPPARTRNPELRLLKSQRAAVERKLRKVRWELEILEREETRVKRLMEQVLQPNLPIA